jgi:hypothetical protein
MLDGFTGRIAYGLGLETELVETGLIEAAPSGELRFVVVALVDVRRRW